MPSTWRVYAYDVWGNEEEGFEVNDVYRTLDTAEVEDEGNVFYAFVEAGLLDATLIKVDDNSYGEDVVYLVSTEFENPVGEIRKEE